ncbi:MAG: hypothetical protein MK213_10105 [Planctomycetes bacterium]|nr:hypothetical protein [Planctomycetota bacterium]
MSLDSDIRHFLQKVGGAVSGNRARNLDFEEAASVFRLLLSGKGSSAQVAAFLVAIRSKGMTGDELAGFVTAARARLPRLPLPTGTLVISTGRMGKRSSPLTGLASAAAVAATGTPVLLHVAEHARGSGVTLGDMWQRMVGPVPGDQEGVQNDLATRGIAAWTPTRADSGWDRLLEIENALGLRCAPETISKLLVDPACSVLVPSLAGPVLGLASDAMAQLGHRKGLILQGVEGSLDVLVTERTRGMWLEEGSKSPLRLEPRDHGLEWPSEPEAQEQDWYEASEKATRMVLSGVEGPELACALLGAGLQFLLVEKTRDLATGIELARDAISSGAAERILLG